MRSIPPDEAVFVPQDQQIAEIVPQLLEALGLELEAPVTPTATAGTHCNQSGPTPTPTITPTPLPGGIDLREQVSLCGSTWPLELLRTG